MRNKKGGLHHWLQSKLLTEFKNKIYSSTLKDLALQFKLQFKKEKSDTLTKEMLNDINNDSTILEEEGDLVTFCTTLSDKEKIELLTSIKDESTEGKNFYMYVFLIILARKKYQAAKILLSRMIEDKEYGLENGSFIKDVLKEEDTDIMVEHAQPGDAWDAYRNKVPTRKIRYRDWQDAVQQKINNTRDIQDTQGTRGIQLIRLTPLRLPQLTTGQ
jgi:hypothetical protein